MRALFAFLRRPVTARTFAVTCVAGVIVGNVAYYATQRLRPLHQAPIEVSIAAAQTTTVRSGNPRIDDAWHVVARYYPDEAARVTAIRVEPSNGALAWVADKEPTVIVVSREHAHHAALSRLERTLAHELMHVTQFHDEQPADHAARQREATMREELFGLKRTTALQWPPPWE